MAAALMVALLLVTTRLPDPPAAPDPRTCCRRSCEPCIFDYYDAAFAAWEAEVRALGGDPAETLTALGLQRAAKPARSGF